MRITRPNRTVRRLPDWRHHEARRLGGRRRGDGDQAGGPNEHRLVLLQGDTCQAGDPSDGAVSRRQIADVLVRSLTSEQALRKTFEFVAAKGPAQDNFDALFAGLEADPPGALDGVRDAANQPLADEPRRVRDDLQALLAHRAAA